MKSLKILITCVMIVLFSSMFLAGEKSPNPADGRVDLCGGNVEGTGFSGIDSSSCSFSCNPCSGTMNGFRFSKGGFEITNMDGEIINGIITSNGAEIETNEGFKTLPEGATFSLDKNGVLEVTGSKEGGVVTWGGNSLKLPEGEIVTFSKDGKIEMKGKYTFTDRYGNTVEGYSGGIYDPTTQTFTGEDLVATTFDGRIGECGKNCVVSFKPMELEKVKSWAGENANKGMSTIAMNVKGALNTFQQGPSKTTFREGNFKQSVQVIPLRGYAVRGTTTPPGKTQEMKTIKYDYEKGFGGEESTTIGVTKTEACVGNCQQKYTVVTKTGKISYGEDGTHVLAQSLKDLEKPGSNVNAEFPPTAIYSSGKLTMEINKDNIKKMGTGYEGVPSQKISDYSVEWRNFITMNAKSVSFNIEQKVPVRMTVELKSSSGNLFDVTGKNFKSIKLNFNPTEKQARFSLTRPMTIDKIKNLFFVLGPPPSELSDLLNGLKESFDLSGAIKVDKNGVSFLKGDMSSLRYDGNEGDLIQRVPIDEETSSKLFEEFGNRFKSEIK